MQACHMEGCAVTLEACVMMCHMDAWLIDTSANNYMEEHFNHPMNKLFVVWSLLIFSLKGTNDLYSMAVHVFCG